MKLKIKIALLHRASLLRALAVFAWSQASRGTLTLARGGGDHGTRWRPEPAQRQAQPKAERSSGRKKLQRTPKRQLVSSKRHLKGTSATKQEQESIK